MRIAHNTHVLVADGRKMLFLRNEGDAEHPRLEVVRKREQDNPPDRDQKTDGPGTGFSGSGPRRGSMQEVDFHQLEEDRFAAQAADYLKRGALSSDYEKLIVIAPPNTLGELRKHYHKEVSERLEGELAKDLTSHPIDEIERLLIAAN